MVETINLTLTRDKPGPWGFRLQGGVDFEKALTVAFSQEGSSSFNSGLRTGDVIVNIGSLEGTLLTHKEAQEAILEQGDSVKLTVQRTSFDTGLAPGTWKPDVQIVGDPATGPASQGQVYTKTSLTLPQKPQEEHWDVKHNITAKGFQPGGSSSIASTGVRSVAAPTSNDQGGGVSGFRSVSAPTQNPGAAFGAGSTVGPPKQQVCWLCNGAISGVFLQVKGRPIHGECFNCSKCRCSLKNVGHFVIGEKLYCQPHAREAQNALQGISQGLNPEPKPPIQGLPQGLAQNLAKISIKAPGATRDQSCPAPPPLNAPPQAKAPADWSNRLNADKAGMAGNAEDFTKEFMKQLAGGTGV